MPLSLSAGLWKSRTHYTNYLSVLCTPPDIVRFTHRKVISYMISWKFGYGSCTPVVYISLAIIMMLNSLLMVIVLIVICHYNLACTGLLVECAKSESKQCKFGVSIYALWVSEYTCSKSVDHWGKQYILIKNLCNHESVMMNLR